MYGNRQKHPIAQPSTKALPVFGKLLCATNRHNIDRHRVWHDSVDHRTRCTRCSTELVRDLDGWRLYDPPADDQPDRLPHPRMRVAG